MEEIMRLLTIFELASRSDTELSVIYKDMFNELARSAAGTPERRNALGSLENIRRVMRSRPQPKGPWP
tara:strand:- start:8702 stop:8905 length:204 start_codon:yes stop_codon:yes gene_type:complete